MKKVIFSLLFLSIFLLFSTKSTSAYNGYADIDIASLHVTTTPPPFSSNLLILSFTPTPSSSAFRCDVYKNNSLYVSLFFRGNPYCYDSFGGTFNTGDNVYVVIKSSSGTILYETDPSYVYSGDKGNDFVVSGTVYYDVNNNETLDPADVIVPKVPVTISGSTTQTTTSDASGNYAFLLVPNGNYSINITTPNGYRNTTSNPAGLSLTQDTQVNFGIFNQNPPVIQSNTITKTSVTIDRDLEVFFSPSLQPPNTYDCAAFDSSTNTQLNSWGNVLNSDSTSNSLNINVCVLPAQNFDHPEWPSTNPIYIKIRNHKNGDILYQSNTFTTPSIPPTVTVTDFREWIYTGGTYTNTGFFTDPDSSSWTATVDYGDGSGLQQLPLASDNTFLLSHIYATPNLYIPKVTITDAEGATTSQIVLAGVYIQPQVGQSPVSIDHVTYDEGGTSDCPEVDNVSYQPPCHDITFYFKEDLNSLFPSVLVNDQVGWIGGIDNCTVNFPYANAFFTGNSCVVRLGSREFNNFSGFHFNTLQDATVTLTSGSYRQPLPMAIIPYTINFPLVINTQPSINSLSGAVINEGSTYAENGSFTDSDSTSWTATVDYGDGSGLQPLTISNTNFSLNHRYKDNGTYTVTVSVTDNQGATATIMASVTVNNVAPTVGVITAPASPTQVNTAITASANFTDPGILDTHTASWNWGDGNTTSGTVTESNGVGLVSDSHTYTTAGVYTVTLTVADNNNGSGTTAYQYIVMYDTSAGFITGSGKYNSLAGWDTQHTSASGDVKFGIQAKYNGSNTTPIGNTKWNFKNSNLDFVSTAYDWLVVSSGRATLKGHGTINGSGSYTFLTSVIDGSQSGGVNKIRFQIKDSSGNVIYDTQLGDPDTIAPNTNISAGNIKIH